MKRAFRTVIIFAAAATFAVVPLFADDPKPATTKATAATTQASPAGEAKVAPDAAPLLAKVRDAYANLKGLRADGSLHGEFDVDGEKEDVKVEFASTFDAPNRFKHEVKPDAVIGSTGDTLYIHFLKDNVYRTAAAPNHKVATDELPPPFGQLVGAQNISLALALASDAAAELTRGYASVAKADDVKIDAATFPALKISGGSSGAVLTVAVDPKTNLVRRAMIDVAGQIKQRGAKDVKKAQLTMDYPAASAAEAAAKPNQFAWAPPAGARDAATMQQDQGDGAGNAIAAALEGKPAPTFKLKALDGKEVSLSDLKGSVVVLDFWATWCPPCIMSMPATDKLLAEKKEAGVKGFFVNQAEEADAVQGFVKSRNLATPVLLDPDGKVNTTYHADEAIPLTVIIGKDGVVRKAFVGIGPGHEQKFREAVEAAVAAAK